MASKLKISSYILLPFFAIAIIIVISIILTSGSHIEIDLPEIEKRGSLKVVTDYNSVGYYVSGDTIAGFNSELLNKIGEYANLNIDVDVQNDLSRSVLDLKNGKYDLIARNLPVNTALRDQLAFTQPILRNKLVLIQRIPDENSGNQLIRSHLDLAKSTIYVPKGSPAIFRLKNLSKEIGDTIFVRQDSLYETAQLIMQVASGEIPFTISDANTAKLMLNILPEIDINTDIGFTHLESWAVRKNSLQLLDSLNSWINRLQDTKEFMDIYNRYYSPGN